MRPVAILKFIVKLLLLEAFVILVTDAIFLASMNEFGQGLVLLPVGTLLYYLMTAPFAMLIYVLLRIDYGYNNKNLLHIVHVLVFIGVLLVYGSDFTGGDELMLYIPGAAVIVSSGVVIYMKSPKDPLPNTV